MVWENTHGGGRGQHSIVATTLRGVLIMLAEHGPFQCILIVLCSAL